MAATNSILRLRSLGVSLQLGELVTCNAAARATKSVDLIFTLSGLAAHSQDPLLTPSYHKPERDVFTDLIQHQIDTY